MIDAKAINTDHFVITCFYHFHAIQKYDDLVKRSIQDRDRRRQGFFSPPKARDRDGRRLTYSMIFFMVHARIGVGCSDGKGGKAV
jgi:hypothetical protein